MLGLAWQRVGLSAGGASSLSLSLTTWGNKTWGKLQRAQTPAKSPGVASCAGTRQRKHAVQSQALAVGPPWSRNDLCRWNGALLTRPLWEASQTRTRKSDNNQEKASCSWFVRRRPWATVLSAIHRSLESAELCRQLQHSESGSFELGCGKLLNSNNTQENCLILRFVKICSLDQVHQQVLNHQNLRSLKRFEWTAGRGQATRGILSWVFLHS